MKETTVVICGKEKEWLGRFARYLREKAMPGLNVPVFSGREELEAYLSDHPAELAIVPEEMAAEFETVCRTLYFTEEDRPGDPRAMYRYRPAGRHLSQILSVIGSEAGECGQPVRADVQAVWSPVRGAGTTAAAVLLGLILSEKEPTLLVSAERYSALPALLPREREGNLVWICPAAEPEDLRSAAGEDWAALILALRASGRYRHVVIDAGDGPGDEVRILEAADRIWMPTKQNGIALQRERAFRARLEREGREELLDRTVRFSFPETEEVRDLLDYRQLLHTQWGRCIRRLVREEA